MVCVRDSQLPRFLLWVCPRLVVNQTDVAKAQALWQACVAPPDEMRGLWRLCDVLRGCVGPVQAARGLVVRPPCESTFVA